MNNGMRGKKVMETVHKVPRFLMNLHNQGMHNSAEFLLHELSLPHCFNLLKSAYFIDNPDFNHLKGVAGFSHDEQFVSANHWDQPDLFSKHMGSALFNQKVRGIDLPSIRTVSNEKEMLCQLAKDLGVHKPSFKKMPVKHDNVGIFIFEPCDHAEHAALDQNMEESLYLLGFTPVI